MGTAYIGLGANLGNRFETLEWAIDRLGALGTVDAVSGIYETEPLHVLDQPRFLNGVARVKTALRPESVLAGLLAIELDAGRIRAIRHGARTLDLDLLLYDDLVIQTSDLTLPHPRLHDRAFVLVPLNEIASSLFVPGLDLTVSQLLVRLDSTAGVASYTPDP